MRLIKELGKRVLGKGVVAPIFSGPLRGKRYRLNKYSGLATMFGGWEVQAQSIFAGTIHPGDVVYDLGANTGIHALYFAQLIGKAGRVFAFEPTPVNISELEETIALNQVTNITVMPMAIGAADGKASFAAGHHSKAGSLDLSVGGDPSAVQMRRLDTLVGEGLAPPNFIKIDIEGGEGAALRGAVQTIGKHHPQMYIELHNPTQDIEVADFLRQQGYLAYRCISADAKTRTGQSTLLKQIDRFDAGWEADDGFWGCVVALHPLHQSRWQAQVTQWT